MFSSILKIIATLLPLLTRWLEGAEKRREKRDVATFEKAVAGGDVDAVNRLLRGVPSASNISGTESLPLKEGRGFAG